jgi:hypothetical protein
MLCALAIGAQGTGVSVVETAGAQLPQVDVPELPVPELPVPEVPVPDVPLPEVPAVPAPPAPQLPPAPAVPPPPPPPPAAPQAPSSSAGSPSAAPAPAASPRAAAPSSASPGSGPARPAARGAAPSARSDGAVRRRPARARKPAAERRLRGTVRRLAGCLDGLRQRQRRVLVLRTGLGPRAPMSRARVGVRLDLPVARVARIERRGVRRLRALGEDGCGGIAAETAIALGAAPGALPGPPAHPAPMSEGAPGRDGASGSRTDPPRSGVKGEFDASPDDKPAVVVPPVGRDGAGGTDLSIAAVLLGVLMLGYALRRELSSSGPSPG